MSLYRRSNKLLQTAVKNLFNLRTTSKVSANFSK